MAISVFGVAANPADLSSFNENSGACAITPPASMTSGQLVVIFSDSMSANGARVHHISQAGGQTWNTAFTTTTAFNTGVFWCQFNGTWSANPSVAVTSNATSEGFQAAMLVISPSGASPTWSLESSGTNTNYAAPSSPFNVTTSGLTPVTQNTIAVAYWFTGVSVLPSPAYTLQTSGWVAPGGAAQWRNSNRGTVALGVNLGTSPGSPTGSVTTQMSASQGGWTNMMIFSDGLAASGGGGGFGTNIPPAQRKKYVFYDNYYPR